MSDKLVLPGGPITVDTFTDKDGRRVLSITEGAVKPNNRPAPGPKANTLGQVTPQTEPNRSGSTSKPPVKPEQAPEKGFLEGIKEGIDDFIDKSVESAGFSQPAMVLGAVGKALNEVFMPTAAWELIPVGKGAKILKKGGEAVGVVKKGDAAAKTAEAAKSAPRHKVQAGAGGGRVDGPKKGIAESGETTAEQGGLNLFKWGKESTTRGEGWRDGDYMLNLPSQGSPAANWAQNSSRLREVMGEGKPIFDSYRDVTTGMQIPTRGFLNAERNLLESRGWRYNAQTGAYHPPIP